MNNTTENHCSTCANKGKINGLSQETYCEQCVFQDTWRQDHYTPKPVKQKIDWSKTPTAITETFNRNIGTGKPLFPTSWVAWNCDEHTRGNPLPDGLVVEWYGIMAGSLITGNPTWEFVTRFRIVGIQG